MSKHKSQISFKLDWMSLGFYMAFLIVLLEKSQATKCLSSFKNNLTHLLLFSKLDTTLDTEYETFHGPSQLNMRT